MSSKDKYKKAFSSIIVRESFDFEVKKMENKRKNMIFKKFALGVASVCVVIGITTSAYAKDFLGIQRKL